MPPCKPPTAVLLAFAALVCGNASAGDGETAQLQVGITIVPTCEARTTPYPAEPSDPVRVSCSSDTPYRVETALQYEAVPPRVSDAREAGGDVAVTTLTF